MQSRRYGLRASRAVLFLCALLLSFATAATAQYPPTVGNGAVNRSTVKQCQCVQFSGDGFEPGSQVTITDNGVVVARVTADSQGRFRHRVCFDERSAQGEHELRGSGTNPSGGAHVVRAVVTVRGDTCFRRGDEVNDESEFREFPATGAGTTVPALLLGFGLVATGSGVVFLARRRRRAQAAY